MSDQILEPGQIEAAANIPPFLHLPEPDLFSRRARRLLSLAADHPLAAYLLLMADLCEAQQRVLDAPPPLPGPSDEALARSFEHRMPPLAFDTLVRGDAWQPALDALLAEIKADPRLAELALVRQSRLSVMPVGAEHWAILCDMAGWKDEASRAA